MGIPGAVVGAGIGGLSGVISGGSQIFQAKDEAFKSYVQEQAEGALSEQDSMISSGSAIAGSREQTQMAFAQRLGSEAAANAYLDQVKTMAAKTNYSYDEITGYSKLLLNSYQAEETLGILQTLSDATAGLNLSSGDVNMMISGLSRMRTTGKATQEYLNYFRERGVDVDQALAGELGVDKSKISDMVSKGRPMSLRCCPTPNSIDRRRAFPCRAIWCASTSTQTGPRTTLGSVRTLTGPM